MPMSPMPPHQLLVARLPLHSPEALRLLPKAPPRKGNQWNRRKIKSAVLTDTLVKDEIAAIEAGKRVTSSIKRIFADEKPKKEKAKKLNKENNKRKKKIVSACVASSPFPTANLTKSGFNSSNARDDLMKLALGRINIPNGPSSGTPFPETPSRNLKTTKDSASTFSVKEMRIAASLYKNFYEASKCHL
nr:unnamed protein product [Callosobruchus chinensis]